MARYGIIGLLSCFYLAGAVLFIQSQGRAYREELGRARHTDSVDPAVTTSNRAPQPTASTPISVAQSDPPRANAESSTAAPASQVPTQHTGADQKSQASANSIQPAGSPAVRSTASTLPGDLSGDVAKSVPSPEKLDPFWSQSFLTKDWDLGHLTARDENTLGQELHNVIIELNPVDEGPGRGASWKRRSNCSSCAPERTSSTSSPS